MSVIGRGSHLPRPAPPAVAPTPPADKPGAPALPTLDVLKALPRTHIGASLVLDRVAPTTFHSVNFWKPTEDERAVFGGQILGQALVAATRTVPDEDFRVHSLHAYFLRPGITDTHAEYSVDLTRDGRTFANREVAATQTVNGVKKAIFTAQFSFHKGEDSVMEHQDAMPEGVPDPETLHSRGGYLDVLAERYLKAGERERYAAVDKLRNSEWPDWCPPLDLRYVNPDDGVFFFNQLDGQPPRDARMLMWVRCRNVLPNLPWVHTAVAAYASDAGIITPALFPLGTEHHEFTMSTSLDHSMWFHAPFRADEWLLYEMESHRAAGGRAFSTGRMFRRDGVVCMSVAQEALIRYAPRAGTSAAPSTKKPIRKQAKL